MRVTVESVRWLVEKPRTFSKKVMAVARSFTGRALMSSPEMGATALNLGIGDWMV